MTTGIYNKSMTTGCRTLIKDLPKVRWTSGKRGKYVIVLSRDKLIRVRYRLTTVVFKQRNQILPFCTFGSLELCPARYAGNKEGPQLAGWVFFIYRREIYQRQDVSLPLELFRVREKPNIIGIRQRTDLQFVQCQDEVSLPFARMNSLFFIVLFIYYNFIIVVF